MSPAQTISPTPSAASRSFPSEVAGRVAADAARVTIPAAVPTIPRTPAATSSAEDGSRWGCHGSSSADGCSGGVGSRSNRTVARSTPEMPSTSEWWVFEISAKRSPSSPSTSQFSHSGLSRSSGWEAIRAASRNSCSSLPGAGSAVWRTWYSMLKSGSSTHSGRPVSSGGVASFCR